MTFTKKNLITMILSVLIMIAGVFAPPMFGLQQLAVRTLFFTIALLALLVTETLHIGIIAIFMVVLQPILGLTSSFAESVTNFNTPMFFFLLSAFIIAGAVQESKLSRRVLKFLLLKFGKTTRGTITAILLSTALLSTVIANLPALILFYGISLNFLDMFDNEADRKQSGKSLCIGLIYASLCGGYCTVVGNMVPMLTSSYLTSAGYSVSFLQWMAIGTPIGILTFILMLFVLFKVFPPVEISDEKRQRFIDSIEVPKKMSMQEIYVTSIIGLMLICWLLGSKYPALNTMHVSICGAALMLLPCFKIMSWQTANSHINWAVMLLTCGFVSIAAIFTSTGLTDWIIGLMDVLIPVGTSPIIVLIILGFLCAATLLLISNGPALITVFAMPVIGLAVARGIHPAILAIPLSMFMGYTVLLPIDQISLITYASGTFEMKDEFKAGFPFMCGAIIITSVVAVLMCRLLGL